MGAGDGNRDDLHKGSSDPNEVTPCGVGGRCRTVEKMQIDVFQKPHQEKKQVKENQSFATKTWMYVKKESVRERVEVEQDEEKGV
jgi:hypothetical protein